MGLEMNNGLKQRFTVSPRLAAEIGAGLWKGPGWVTLGLSWESGGKDYPQRAFGRVRGTHWSEFILMGKGSQVDDSNLLRNRLGVPVRSRL